jgi:hypothetical protein
MTRSRIVASFPERSHHVQNFEQVEKRRARPATELEHGIRACLTRALDRAALLSWLVGNGRFAIARIFRRTAFRQRSKDLFPRKSSGDGAVDHSPEFGASELFLFDAGWRARLWRAHCRGGHLHGSGVRIPNNDAECGSQPTRHKWSGLSVLLRSGSKPPAKRDMHRSGRLERLCE